MHKRCIFHIPNNIENGKSGSNIRPRKMLEAFKNIGYDVDYIMGYGKERKESIERIKENISNGVKYDFLYSESSTMPTLLTEKNHLPVYPFLDFGFFKFCKKNGIKIGLFYRDIHWKFDLYKKTLPFYKRIISIMMYKYDLLQYKKYVDVLYLPSDKVKEYIPKFNNIRILPPGAIYDEKLIDKKLNDLKKIESSNYLNIFYVGGISEDIYNLKKLFEVISKKENVKLTICCREKEWDKYKDDYKTFLTNNIQVVHEFGENLKKYYNEADVCNLFLKPTKYMAMSVPIKLFEYLSNNVPIIATNNTVVGEFVKDNKCGWSIEYDTENLSKLLDHLYNNKAEIYEKAKNIKKVIMENTWDKRALQVFNDLK